MLTPNSIFSHICKGRRKRADQLAHLPLDYVSEKVLMIKPEDRFSLTLCNDFLCGTWRTDWGPVAIHTKSCKLGATDALWARNAGLCEDQAILGIKMWWNHSAPCKKLNKGSQMVQTGLALFIPMKLLHWYIYPFIVTHIKRQKENKYSAGYKMLYKWHLF